MQAIRFNYRDARYVLSGILILTTVLRLGFSVCFFGFSTGDEVEILQEGFARAFALQYEPWRIRHLLVSDLLGAPALWLAAAVGCASTSCLVWVARLPFVVMATGNVFLVFVLARRWLHHQNAAVLAALLYGFHWIPLGYGSTSYPRTATTLCVLLAARALTVKNRETWWAFGAGVAVAVAFAFRFSEIIYVAPCCALILCEQQSLRDKIRRCIALLGGLLTAATLIVGIEDWLTWGLPFASLLHFVRFTIIDKASSSLVAVQPWYFYLWRLPKWLPFTVLPFFAVDVQWRRTLRPLLFVVIPLIVLSTIHHKELRYLQGLMPFAAIAIASASWTWWQQGRRIATAVLVSLSLLSGLQGLTFLAKTSMAAVMAARDLGQQPHLERVALSQAWAYGGKLWLPQVQVRDLPVRPTVEDMSATATDCQTIGLYQDVVETSPDLAAWLENHGFRKTATYQYLRSRPVMTYERTAESRSAHRP